MDLEEFLSNSHQYVSKHEFDSPQLPVTCGVPEGSTLGPLLFLLIYDVQFFIKPSTVSHFADDTSLLYASSKQMKIWIRTKLWFEIMCWMVKS